MLNFIKQHYSFTFFPSFRQLLVTSLIDIINLDEDRLNKDPTYLKDTITFKLIRGLQCFIIKRDPRKSTSEENARITKNPP